MFESEENKMATGAILAQSPLESSTVGYVVETPPPSCTHIYTYHLAIGTYPDHV
jgi:hypothetical protein